MARSARRTARLVLVAALATLALAGCGRRGALEPPPSASVAAPATAAAAPGAPAKTAAVGDSFDASGNPVAAKGEKKRFFLDWLLN